MTNTTSFIIRNVRSGEMSLLQNNPVYGINGFIGIISGHFINDGMRFVHSLSYRIRQFDDVYADVNELLKYLGGKGGANMLTNVFSLKSICEACPEDQIFPDYPNIWAFTTCSEKYHYILRFDFSDASDNCDVIIMVHSRDGLRRAGLDLVPEEFT